MLKLDFFFQFDVANLLQIMILGVAVTAVTALFPATLNPRAGQVGWAGGRGGGRSLIDPTADSRPARCFLPALFPAFIVNSS